MSSVVDPQPEHTAGEELVAYLDGELPPEDCRRIEERLAADADYRQQLRDLDKAWEVLDVLPGPKASDNFARTTMELVTVAAQADASAVVATAAGANRRRTAWYAAAALAGVLIGFVLAWALLPDPNLALLRDLPVIRRFETLRQVGNVDFLRRLADEVPAERLMNDEAAIKNEMAQLTAITSPSLETRLQWVEELPAEEKVVLAAQAKQFDNLKPATQNELRSLERDISAGGQKMQRALLAYEQWLSQLTAGQQEELRQELTKRPVEEQVKFVERLVQREREQASRQLSAQDAEALRKALPEIAIERQAELAALRRRRGDDDRGRRNEGGVATIIARALMRNDDESRKIRDRLTRDLSPDAKAHLDSLYGWRQNAQLWRWIGESRQMKVDSDKLEQFFADREKLNNEQREQLLSLPPDQMQASLERLYYATELGYGDAAEWMSHFREWGGWPNRPGPGGPDGPGFRPDGPPPGRDRREGPRRLGGPDRPGGPGGPDGPPPPREEDFHGGPRPFGPPPNGPPRRGLGPDKPRPDVPPPPRNGQNSPEDV